MTEPMFPECQYCDQPARYHIVTATGRILDVCDQECEHGDKAVLDAMHFGSWTMSVICGECGWLDDHADTCELLYELRRGGDRW